MTDEERKQFINEYCRNVGNIKIKCDDCKFVEDCVDYGWEGCKKFTQKQPHTNEEWLKMMTTEQLAEWLRGVYWHCHEIDCEHCNYPWRCMEKGDIVEWLKQPHTEKE